MDTLEKTRTVLLQEVGPRDGLQNEQRSLVPDVRAKLIDDLADAGLQRIQIGSFVNPRRVPQMAGTDLVWQRLTRKKGVRYSVLILNRRGLEQAQEAGIPHVEIYVSASETHSLKNSGAPVDKALSEASGMIEEALSSGMGVTAGVMCAFGCFYEGVVSVRRVVEMVQEFERYGPEEIGLADTTGMGEPDGMRKTIDSLANTVNVDRLAIHLHDTRGFGMDNMVAALERGVRRFDASVGGLGGCPFIPAAAGNVSTELVVEALESMGFHTGVDASRIGTVKEALERLLGRRLTRGRVVRDDAGAQIRGTEIRQ